MTTRILTGDVREVLAGLADKSVNSIITSVPYWGLRAYLPPDHPKKRLEIGSEPTVDAWVETLVHVFGLARRVLRDDGTLWLNVGDSYAGSRGAGTEQRAMTDSRRRDDHLIPRSDLRMPGLKPKDLVGQPWRLAFALQADGWWLRQEIIWAKPGPMPESVRDRFTKAHETVFLLAKSERYYWDFAAVQEPVSGTANARRAIPPAGWASGDSPHTARAHQTAENHRKVQPAHGSIEARKLRASASHKSHPDVMRNGIRPPKADLATSGNDGAYEDGKSRFTLQTLPSDAEVGSGTKNNASFDEAMAVMPETRNPRSVFHVPEDEYLQFLAWKDSQPIAPDVRVVASAPFSGPHFATFPPALIRPFVLAGCPPGGVVLDLFGGSGTAGLVCDQHGRDCILIDIDERNAPMARGRIESDSSLFSNVETT